MSRSSTMARVVNVALLFVMGSTYSLSFAVNKIAVNEGVPNLAYVFWYSLGAALVLLPICAIRRDLPKLSRAHLPTYAAWGLLTTAAPISLLTYIAPHLPAGIITMTLVLVPLCTYVLALVFRADRFHPLGGLGILLGLAGVLLVLVPRYGLPSPDMVGWLLLALLAPVCFGLVTVFAGIFRPPAASSVTLVCGLLFASAAMMLPIMLATGQGYAFQGASLLGNLSILFASGLVAFVFVLFLEIVRMAGPVFFTQHNYVATLVGFGWGALFFGEGYSPYIWGATALMFLGLGLLNYGQWRAQRAVAGLAPPLADQPG